MDPIYDVAIIGMGFAGTALAVQLMARLPQGSRLALVSGDGAIGEGLAYATRNPLHLLNVPVYRISMMPEDPHHFIRWLWSRQDEGGDGTIPAAGYSYVERSLYAAYVRSTFDRAVAERSGRIAVRPVMARAERIDRSEEGLHRIRLADGRTIDSRFVALCLGNGIGPLPLPPDRVAAEARGRIIDDPFHDARLAEIGPEARVLLVGTGLTMVDTALTLAERGVGALTALSRHGLLPQAQVEPRPTPVQPVEIDSPVPLTALFAMVRGAARRLMAEGGDWRAVIDGLRPKTQRLWQSLSAADRRRFLRHLDAYWTIHRHRMAPAVFERLAALKDAGRLRVVAGRVGAIGMADGRPAVSLRRRGTDAAETIAFDWVINCAALDRGNLIGTQPLVAALYDAGAARPDPIGLGIDVDAASRLLDAQGRPGPGLFALGPPTVGRFFEITAVAEIRAQAAAVATEIAAEIARANGSAEDARAL